VLTSVTARDFPVVQTVVVLIGVFLIVVNLLVDILYAFIDPRIRYARN
jgi:peptide/nickel transport system permease protein